MHDDDRPVAGRVAAMKALVARVAREDLDLLLRWALVASALSMSVFTVLLLGHMAWAVVTALWGLWF